MLRFIRMLIQQKTFFQFCRELLQTKFFFRPPENPRVSKMANLWRIFRLAFCREEGSRRGDRGTPGTPAPSPAIDRATPQGDTRKVRTRAIGRAYRRPSRARGCYANAGITSRANSSTVCGGAMSANMIVNIVMPHATRSRNCLITSSGVPFTAVNENGLRPLAISHF